VADVGLLYVGGVMFVNTVILSGDADPTPILGEREETEWVARLAHATSLLAHNLN